MYFKKRTITYYTTLYFIPLVLFFILTFMVYWESVESGFMGDDYTHCHYFLGTTITERIIGIFKAFKEVSASVKNVFGFYRPLFHTWITINYSLFKLNSENWHKMQLALQSVNVFLFYIFLLNLIRILKIRNIGIFSFSIIGGLIFCFCSVNYFAVNWLAGSHDLLVNFCFLLSLIFYLKLRKKGDLRYYVYTLFAFLCASFFKETVMGFFAIYVFIEILFLFGSKAKKISALKILLFLTGFIFILAINYLARWAVLGAGVIGYDTLYAEYYFNENYQKILDEFTIFPTTTSILDWDLFGLKNSLRNLILGLLFVRILGKDFLFRIKLVIFGLLWAAILVLPGLPFPFGIWRFYSGTLGICIIGAAILSPPVKISIKYFNKIFLLILKAVYIYIILSVLFINKEILIKRTEGYCDDQKRESKFFPQLKKQLPNLEDDAILYFVNPYRSIGKIYGIAPISVTYNKKMNIQVFPYYLTQSIKPTLLDKTYILEWDEKESKFIFRDDIKKWTVDVFAGHEYNPFASWEFNGFKTPPPELQETGCFEFSSENLGDSKGVLVEFRINNFFDVAENEVNVRLSAIPISENSSVNFFYIYSLVPSKMNSWHFIPLDIDPSGEFKEFKLNLHPNKKYNDIYWWDGNIFRMGLQFSGPFKMVKIDYVRTIK